MTTLEDLRVLDLSDGVAGAFCTKLFADYGADVIVIEPPGGHPLRRQGPFVHDRPERETGAVWLYLGSNKRSVTLDIRSATGRAIFRKLVEGANVVVESSALGTMESLGLGFAALHGIKRRIILTSITPFGQGVTGGDKELGEDAETLAGFNSFAASAIATYNADAYEVPQHIDIAISECIAAASALVAVGVMKDPPFQMSEVERLAGDPPRLGEHNTELYCGELGMEPRELARLRAAGVI